MGVSYSFIGIAISVAFLSVIFTLYYPLTNHPASVSSTPKVVEVEGQDLYVNLLHSVCIRLLRYFNIFCQRLFTVEDLATFNGSDTGLPILLGILGSVFDVTKGKSHYGPGGGYHHFAGRDASRAFVSGNFTGDGLTDSLVDLSSTEVKSIVEWRDFYTRTYTYVGKLVGRYYNSEGEPTKYLKGVEAKAARGAQLMEKQKKEEAKVPGCNSKWSQDEGSEVWCDHGYPRLVQRPLEIALTGKMSKRCACYNETDLDQPGLEIYEGCGYLSKSCRL